MGFNCAYTETDSRRISRRKSHSGRTRRRSSVFEITLRAAWELEDVENHQSSATLCADRRNEVGLNEREVECIAHLGASVQGVVRQGGYPEVSAARTLSRTELFDIVD